MGYFGDDGVLWFTDRYKDVIKTGGENVASIEVEKAVYAADPRVAEAVVVGLPHERWSEAVTAFVVPKPGETIDAGELIAALKTGWTDSRCPSRWSSSTSCPRLPPARSRRTWCGPGTPPTTAPPTTGLPPRGLPPRRLPPRGAGLNRVPVLTSHLDPGHGAYLANRAAQLALLGQLQAQLELAIAGGGERYQQRHRARGRLLARERIELLLDPDSPFLELSTLAAWGTEFTVGASLVTGIGVVSGVECVIIGHDPTVRGGAMNPYSLRKILRALEIARANRLPVINLVESGGADLPTQADLFVPAGQIFRDLTELSALAIPTIALVFGNSTAGGAYVPGMCDYAVLVDQQAKVFLGGPPLVKMATGEEADDEALGGAEMHSRVSGLSDYFAVDEHDAIRIGRAIMARLNWRKLGPPPGPAAEPRYDPDEILGLVSADVKVPFDPREILARVVDGSDFDEYKPLYGTSLVTGWAAIHGYPVGVLANHRGVLFSEESRKATEFILLANQTDTPLVFLQNTTGYMVGTSYEQGGIIKDGAKMINAVTNSAVPHLTVNLASSFGAGNYGMSGRAYDPRFMFAWPGARLAVMGAAQLAGVLSIVGRAAPRPPGGRSTRRRTGPAPPRSRPRSRPSRTPSSSPPASTTTASSTRATPAPCWAWPCPPSTPLPSRAAAASACSGCDAQMPTRCRTPIGISKLLVANRGEIAARIMRTAHALGIATVAVYSDADAGAPYVTQADEAVRLPGTAPADTYLRGEAIIAAAAAHRRRRGPPRLRLPVRERRVRPGLRRRRADLRRPGARGHRGHGLKIAAKAIMAAAGVPVLPSVTVQADPESHGRRGRSGRRIGFPLLVKAAYGGGGRGMRLVRDPAELPEAVSRAQREAAAAFGDGTVFLERFVEDPRHVEVQILGDTAGAVVHLFERECSIQRRYQKIVEECPSPAVNEDLRRALTEAAVAAGRAIGYTGAGTVEFVLDRDGSFFFLEVNTRLQVEHPVTEQVTGLDLVELQLRIAAGEPLPPQVRDAQVSGHAIEARLYAEDAAAGFVPATGVLHRFAIPDAPGIRVDAGVAGGSVVSPHYDAMLAKVIAHGRTRAEAARRLARALERAEIHGVTTNRDLLVGDPARAGVPGRGAPTPAT